MLLKHVSKKCLFKMRHKKEKWAYLFFALLLLLIALHFPLYFFGTFKFMLVIHFENFEKCENQESLCYILYYYYFMLSI